VSLTEKRQFFLEGQELSGRRSGEGNTLFVTMATVFQVRRPAGR